MRCSAEIMTRSRIIVGLAVFISTATPLYLLSKVTYGVRYGILTKIHDDVDMPFPTLAWILWPFGPLDWWSYITPVAFAVGVAARIPSTVRLPVLSALLGFSVIQAIVIFGAFAPFEMLGKVMGHPEPAPYPTLPLVANVAMVAASMIFAMLSIRGTR